MVPDQVLADCREKARVEDMDSRAGRVAAAIVVCIWILVAVLVGEIIFRILFS